MTELALRLQSLAVIAKAHGIGFTLDAKEGDRLDISLDVNEAILVGRRGLDLAVQA